MKSESALELQARIFSRIFNYIEMPAAAGFDQPFPSLFVDPFLLEEKAARGRRRRPKTREVEDIALGVSESPADAKLAVLVQDRNKLRSTIVDEIVDAARGEAEVLYIGRQRGLWTTTRNDPLRLGCSISPSTVEYAGTFGCFCRDDADGRIGILSNNHVLGDVNRIEPSTPIMQPGARDGGQPGADDIAEFVRFVPIRFGGVPNMVDAAFAAIVDSGREEDRATLYQGADEPEPAMTFQPGTLIEAEPGMDVFKTGRTTVHTQGRVRAVNVNNFNVDMGAGIARFDGQIIMEMAMTPARPFSRPGDSGSIIVDAEGRPVALLFAGSQSGGAGNLGITGANPISSVVAELGVTLI